MIKAAPALLAALMLSACAGAMHPEPSHGSMVEGVQPNDRKVLVDATVDLVRRNADSANGSIGVQQSPDTEFTPALLDGLRSAGFSVETGDRLLYQIGPIAEGMMLRVSIDGKDAARLYIRDKDGNLAPKGPVTVRSTGEIVE